MANILSYLWSCRFTFQHSKWRAFYLLSPKTGTKSDFLLKYKQTKAWPFSFQAEEFLLPKEACLIHFSRKCAALGILSHTCESKLYFKLFCTHHQANGVTHEQWKNYKSDLTFSLDDQGSDNATTRNMYFKASCSNIDYRNNSWHYKHNKKGRWTRCIHNLQKIIFKNIFQDRAFIKKGFYFTCI